jgi:hypothetical protein
LREEKSLPYIPYDDELDNKSLATLLRDPPRYSICTGRPTLCQVNALFIIDRNTLEDENDLKSDEFSWRNNGNKTHRVMLNSPHFLSKTYFVHKKYKYFKRRIYSLTDNTGQPCRYVMLCYWFQKGEHQVSPNKRVRTQASTLKSMVKKLRSGSSARDVYSETHENAGGLMNAKKVSSLPRTVTQVQKLKERSSLQKKNLSRHEKKDELYAVILKCVNKRTYFSNLSRVPHSH